MVDELLQFNTIPSAGYQHTLHYFSEYTTYLHSWHCHHEGKVSSPTTAYVSKYM